MAGHGRGRLGNSTHQTDCNSPDKTPEMAGLQGNGSKTTTITGAGLRGWKVCNIVQGKEVAEGIYFSSSPGLCYGQIPTMPCFPGLWKHIFRFNKHLPSIYYVPIQKEVNILINRSSFNPHYNPVNETEL